MTRTITGRHARLALSITKKRGLFFQIFEGHLVVVADVVDGEVEHFAEG